MRGVFFIPTPPVKEMGLRENLPGKEILSVKEHELREDLQETRGVKLKLFCWRES